MATAQATPEPQLGFPTKGSLRRFPFPRLIREIARANLTGSLYLLSGQTKKVVFFEEGQPVFVRSNVLSECLGQVLAHEGLITQEQCEQTLEAIRRTGKKQGELLVEMGILSEGNLRYGLQAQLRAKLFDIFSWDDGRYQFKIESGGQTFGVRLDTSAEGVILAAIQDRCTEDRARTALADSLTLYPTLRGHPGEFARELGLELTLEEAFFVACLDGSRMLKTVIGNGVDPGVANPAALLYGLVQSGVVALVDEPQPARATPTRPSFDGSAGEDDAFAPGFEAQDVVTEYEDTPLPGELPRVRAAGRSARPVRGIEDEDAGTGPTQHSVSAMRPKPELPQSLVAAEPAGVVETFEEAIDFGEDESFDGLLDEPVPAAARAPTPVIPPAASLPTPAVVAATPQPAAPVAAVAAAPAAGATPSPQSSLGAALDESVDEPSPLLEPIDEPMDEPLDEPADEFGAAAFFDIQPVDVDTVAEPSSPRPVPRNSGKSDPDATVLDAGLEPLGPGPAAGAAVLAPISVDSIGSDLLGVDELDSVRLEDGDFAGLELEPEEIDALSSGEIDADLVEPPSISVEPEHELSPEALGITPDAIDDDLALDEEPPELAAASDLVSFDELDAVDLGPAPAPAPARYGGAEATMEQDPNPEMVGAVRFNEAEAAMAEGDWAGAVALLEDAYESGFDVAELHAMLAYARFEASGEDKDTAEHALELLDYAQTMDPSLDLVHAYRGAIYRALRQPQRAREALDRALELNPYCELAMQIMDTL
ncbi:MAG: DUF4388 domain-containing protein [Nannocystaceae bacterium]